MKTYNRKFTDQTIIDWLTNRYTSNYQMNFYDLDSNAKIEREFQLMVEKQKLAAKETNLERQLELKLEAREHGGEALMLNNEKSSELFLGIIGFLLSQVQIYTSPQLPIEFWEYLESVFSQENSQQKPPDL